MPTQQKIPLADSLNALAEKTVATAMAQLGKSFPCSVIAVSGKIVTVNFEVTATPFTLPQVKMPVVMSQFAQFPVPVGTKGLCVPADVYIGNVTGLGSATPGDLTPRANLSQLVFLPLSNKNWASIDPTAVFLSDVSGANTVTVATSATTIANGTTKSLIVDSAGVHLNAELIWSNTFTAPSATAGSGGPPPSQVAKYLILNVGGTPQAVPLYNV